MSFIKKVAELDKEGDGLHKSFMTQGFVEKLPDYWMEYKQYFKQKKIFMSLQQTINHIKIEEMNRSLKKVKVKEIIFKANLVEERSSRPPHCKKIDHKPKGKPWNNKKKIQHISFSNTKENGQLFCL